MAPSSPPSPTPEALFERWRRYGDAEALGALFDATSPALFRIALALLPDAATAEDALQETYLSAMQHADAYDATRPLVPWLVGVLQNMARRQRRSLAQAPDPARLAAAGGGLPEVDAATEAESAEEAARLREAIDALDEPYRSVALLRWRYGLEPAEIADVRNEPPGTTRSLLSRALGRLRGASRAAPAVFAGVRIPRGLSAVRETVVESLLPAGAAATVAGGLLLWKALAVVAAVTAVGTGGWLAWQGWPLGGQGAAGEGTAEVATVEPDASAPREAAGPGLRGTVAPPAKEPDRPASSRVARGPGRPGGEESPSAGGGAAGAAESPSAEVVAPAAPTAEEGAASEALRGAIDEAIRGGVEWLKKQQRSDGSWSELPSIGRGPAPSPTLTAQALYVLLRAGTPGDDPAVTRGFGWLRTKSTLKSADEEGVIPVSWGLLAACARHEALRGAERGTRILQKEEASAIGTLSKRLEKLWTTVGWFGIDHEAHEKRRDGDLPGISTASLALAAALRAGEGGSRTMLEASALLELLLPRQEAQGKKHPRAVGLLPETDVARGYRDGPLVRGEPSGTATAWSTAATLVGVHVAWRLAEVGGRVRVPTGWTEARALTSIHDAYAFLDLSWPDVSEIDTTTLRGLTDLQGRLFWFVEVERLIAFLGADTIGAHDASREMARVLVASREKGGGWELATESDPRPTIHALLVLTRSTRPIVDKPFLAKPAPAPK